MRCLKRNRVPFWYALYSEKTPIVDDEGFQTGEYQIKYTNPIKAYANISPSIGETETRQFGIPEEYDKVMVMDLPSVIDEYSILWIDSEPEITADGKLVEEEGEIKTPNDYIVKKVAKSLNSVSYAIKKVTVNG